MGIFELSIPTPPTTKSLLITTGLIFLLNCLGYSQTTTCTTCCATTQYDSGGAAGQYGYNENKQFIYDAGSGKVNKLVFSSFSTELNFDVLKIYNGSGTAGTLLATFSGNVTGAALTTPIYSSSQFITLHFTSDGANLGSGWAVGLTCENSCANTTNGGTVTNSISLCGPHLPLPITNVTGASPSTNRVYQWESSINGTLWSNIPSATNNGYTPTAITQTTYYRRKSKNSSCPTWGATSNTITKGVDPLPEANAGPNKVQCENGIFKLIPNAVGTGETGVWSLISGNVLSRTGYEYDTLDVSLPAGNSASLKWTVSNGTCSKIDTITLTNNANCAPACVNPININGDLENEGNATNFDLTFQGTPAVLIESQTNTVGWVERYGAAQTNPTTFQGAFYVKKTGTQGNPHSGTHMVYLSGPNFCLSSFTTQANIACGKTYQISLWVAAYTNAATQEDSPFTLEFAATNQTGSPSPMYEAIRLLAPKSTSWNSLNWQRYVFTTTIPNIGYDFIDIYFTSENVTKGIVIDDVCITEVNTGSQANAGIDLYSCSNQFTLAATTPNPGYTGSWAVTAGSASFSNVNSPNSTATLNTGTSAEITWTVTDGVCSSFDVVNLTQSTPASILSTTPAARCGPGSVTLGATGSSGIINWYSEPTGGTSLASGNSFNTPSLTQTTTFYIDIDNNGCISSNRVPVIATINPFPIIVTTSPSGNCTAGPVTLSASSDIGIINWYSTSTGGTVLGTGNDFATSISATTTFYISATANGCTTLSRTPIVASLEPSPAIITTYPDTRCGPGTLTLRAKATYGTIQWFDVSLGGTAIATGNIFNTPSLTQTKTYYIETTSPGCGVNPRTAIVATINNIPSITNVTSANICGSGTATLGATASEGQIKWYDIATGGSELLTGTSLTTPVLSTTKNYYVEAISNGCVSSPRTNVNAVVNAIPAITSTTPQSRCGAGSVTLQATSNLGTLNWYNAATGGTLLGTGSSFPSPSISTTTTYYVSAESNGCTSARTAVIATINTMPSISSSTPASRCGAGTLTLGATAASGTINWYNASSGGTSLFTGASFTTPSISSTTIYYADVTLGGCTSARTTVTATINPVPTITSSTPANRCGSGSLVLSATASSGTLSWFDVATGGTSLYTGSNFTTPVLSETKTYYVQATSAAGCTSAARTAVSATINLIPTIISTNPASVCAPGVVILSATASAGTINWYTASTGGTFLIAGNAYAVNITESTTFYLEVVSPSGCVSSSRIPITANLVAVADITATVPGNICDSGSATISATSNTGNVNWYDSMTGGNLLGSGNNFTTPVLSANITYYAEAVASNGCTTGNRVAVPVTINTTPSITNVVPGVRCGTGTVSLQASASAGIINWYNVSSAGASLNTGSTFTTPSISATTQYYVETTANGCTSPRLSVEATVNAIPAISSTVPASNCGPGILTLSAIASEGTISWFDVASGGTSIGSGNSLTTPSLSTSKTYYVEAKSNSNCTSARTSIAATIKNIPSILTNTPASRCGSGTVTISATATSGSTINWYSAATGGTSLFTGASFTTPSITATTTYYAEATLNGCVSSRVAVNATINNIPVITANSVSRCGTGTATLTASTDIASTINWYNTNTSTTILNSGNSFTTPSLSANKSYFISAISTASGCATTARTAATVTINTIPTVLSVTPGTRCDAGSISLSASPSAGTVNWYNVATGGTSIGTGLTFPTPSISATTTFYAEASNLGCASVARTAVIATIDSVANITGTTPASRCGNGTVVLSATSSATINWYATATGGTILYTGPSFTTPSLTATTTYYAEPTSSGCPIPARTPVTATIKPNPTIVSTVPASRCGPGTVTLSATGSAGTLNWYQGSTLIFTGNSYTTPSITTNKTYSVEAESNGCFSAKTSVTATIKTIPTITATTPASRCDEGVLTISATPSAGTIDWYNQNVDGTLLSSGNSYTTPSLSSTTLYYAQATSNGCASPRTSVSASILELPTITSTIPASRCGTGKVTISATTSAGTLVWFATPTGGSSISTDLNFTTPLLSSTVTYYVVANNQGCMSSTRTPVTATVNLIPTITSAPQVTKCGPGISTLTATANFGTIRWYSQATGGSILQTGNTFTTPFLTETTTYYVDADQNGCAPSLRTPVVVTVLQLPSIISTSPASICGSGTVTLSANSSSGIVNWYDEAVGGNLLGTENNFNTPIISETTTYYAEAIQSGCLPSSRIAVTATVKDKPNAVIIGNSALCLGGSTTLSPSTGGTWTSSNPSIASVSSNGIVTAHSVGAVTFIFTDGTTGCESNPTPVVTIYDKPIVSGPSLICVGTTINLSPNSGGTWISTNPAVASVNNSGLVTALSSGNSYFIYTNLSASGCKSDSFNINVNPKPITGINGPSTLCVGATTTLSPSNGGIWTSSNTNVATVTNTGIVTSLSSGSVTFTFTNSTTLCSSDPSTEITFNDKPSVSLLGNNIICVDGTTTFSPSEGGSWLASDPTVASISPTGVVTGLSAGTSTFTFTTSSGCVSLSSVPVTVNPKPSISIEYLGSQCLTLNSVISASASNGSPNYSYSWSGPGGFSGNTQNISVNQTGNFNLVVTDSKGCAATTSAIIHPQFLPQITSNGNSTCDGSPIVLNVQAINSVSYLWSSNASNATINSVTVIPGYPSSTYSVTVTNNNSCTAVANKTINVITKPSVGISGPSVICVSSSTSLSPSTGGTWVSNNPSIATVTSSGYVTGVSQGIATFTFTNSTTGCVSNPTLPITVGPKPGILVSGSTSLCIGSTTTMLPNSGGIWTSSNPSVATINNNGIITAISTGSATFTFTQTDLGCTSDPSEVITVQNQQDVTIAGNNVLCIGQTSELFASKSGGTWTSSNTNILTINQSGVVTAISAGSAIVTYSRNESTNDCINNATYAINISPTPATAITGPATICVGTITSLSPGNGGTWTSSNPAIATVSNGGVVTGISAGSTTFLFTSASTGCTSNLTSPVNVVSKPAISYAGPSTICMGTFTQLNPGSGGTWSSTNGMVAAIDNNGFVTPISPGQANFIFTSGSTGCASSISQPLTVNSKPTITPDFNGSQCLTNNASLGLNVFGGTSPFTYNWTGPSGFTSSLQNNPITANGTYFVTITDANLCSANLSASVYEQYEPLIVSLQTSICEGQSVDLAVSASNVQSYQWDANANNASTQNVTVYPTTSNHIYKVTVTSTLGCTAIAQANITVKPKPIINLNGPSSLCIGSTANFTPSSGGVWSSSNTNVAIITNEGQALALATGSAYFTFIDSYTGCSSDPSTSILVGNKPPVVVTGPTNICIGSNTTLSPTAGGVWTSSDTTIAKINNNGVVTAIGAGAATFTFSINNGQCVSDPSSHITISNKPTVSITGNNSLCLGATTTLSPSTGGLWTSSNPAVASVSNNGVISAISPGNATFTFFQNSSNCYSQPTSPVVVNPKPLVSIAGDSVLCVGENTQLNSSESGIWLSHNTAVASVNNNGQVFAQGPGQTVFTFTNSLTGCKSNATKPVIVNALPYAVITGTTSSCIGGTTMVSPQIGGTWISTNPAIASVNDQGIVTSNSVGQTNFIFTETSSGCVSNVTGNFVVYEKPSINISGPATICIGSNTSLLPSSGGVWISLNPTIASITNFGVVTGYNSGNARFIYTESGTGCVSDTSAVVTVLAKPLVSVTGPAFICVGQNTTLIPDSGGVWISSNNSVATINNNGIVTGVSQGIVTFTYIQNGGCTSLPSTPITINGKSPTNINGPSSICIGNQTQLFPSTGGTWQSTNTNIATVTNSGIVTATGSGKVKFIYTNNSTGCTSDSSSALTVLEPPFVSILGSNSICIGATSQVSPTAGGVWVSDNNNIATINNSGIINGISAGVVHFTFTSLTTGCQSTTPIAINVNSAPMVSLPSDNLCEGATLSLVSPEPGIWTSKNPAIASVTPSGVVTGKSQGVARFNFKSSSTGCISDNTSALTVNGAPQISISGSTNICIGSTTQMFSGQTGVWFTTTPAIISLNSSGLVTGLTNGTGYVGFTAASNGCKSKTNLPIIVENNLVVGLLGESKVCMGNTTKLTPSTGGVWTSSNSNIASVNNNGVVTGLAPGKVSFTFTENNTNCSASLLPEAVTIYHCTDPDFNATFINHVLNGNVSTNDEIPAESINNISYGGNQVLNTKKPYQSVEELVINTDGSYTFYANKEGVYIYNIPVCIGDEVVGCPSEELVLHVIDPLNTNPNPITNVDISTAIYNAIDQPVFTHKWVNTMENDKCSLPSGCNFDVNTLTVEKNASHADIEWSATEGKMKYINHEAHVGMDTIIYNVCISGTSNCSVAKQIITTNSPSAENSVVAADDFDVISKSGTSVMNLLNNDSDPEGNIISITPQGTEQNQIIISQGSYYLKSNGMLYFTPNVEYFGPVDIVYEISDNHSINLAYASATAHILVLNNLKLKLRVYLEGALLENNNAISSSNKPLMRDNIRKNPFNGKNYIPLNDPYSNPTAYVDLTGTTRFSKIGQTNSALEVIADSAGVFSVTGENAIVDWIFVELRHKDNKTQKIATRSGLLQRDGDIVDVDGVSDLSFDVSMDSFYVVVRHRSHLGAMSMKVSNTAFVDFTSLSTPLFDFGTTKYANFDYSGLATNNSVKTGYRSLWAGDANGDGKLKFVNPNDDLNFLFYEVFANGNNLQNNANFNFAYDYYQGDYNMNGKSKFDNPDDDKNLLYAQILFYPLNTQFLSNFNFLIEQVP